MVTKIIINCITDKAVNKYMKHQTDSFESGLKMSNDKLDL